MGFIDAVKQMAEIVGLPIPELQSRTADKDDRRKGAVLVALTDAAALYHHLLAKNVRAMAYLRKRGVSDETITKFLLGYAPDEWHTVASSYRFKKQALEDAGLVIQKDNDKRYDRFRDRIMFPIFNRRGEVLAFAGRIIDKGDPKYLNSPETIVFHKGNELYGLYQAQTAIRIHNHVLVVEGNLDVAMLAQHGFENSVAPLGTAITGEQIKTLLKMVERLTFCFDGDAAGHRAAWKAAIIAAPLVADDQLIDFVFLPDGHDPDSYIREQGAEGFQLQLARAKTLTGFVLNRVMHEVAFDTEEGKAKFISLVRPIAKSITAPALGILFRKRIQQLSGLSDQELQSVYQEEVISLQPPSLASRICLLVLCAPWLASELDAEDLLTSVKEDENWSMLEDVLAALKMKPDMDECALKEIGSGQAYEYRLLRLIHDSQCMGDEFDAARELRDIMTALDG